MTAHANPGIAKAAEAVGGTIARLAKMIGVTRSAVHQWPRIPAERVLEVERVTGVPRHELRPDIYPPPELAAAGNAGAARRKVAQ